MRVTWATAVATAVSAAASACFIFTGGTDGYTPSEGGGGGACQSSRDCSGQLCCYTLGDAALPTQACQTTCPAWEQSCTVGSDCGDGGSCTSQSCTVEGATVSVTTCGPIPICTQ